jgi:methyl-accepting chemotaxis protein
MIGSIQSGTEHAVDSMRNSTERAESTLNIARVPECRWTPSTARSSRSTSATW